MNLKFKGTVNDEVIAVNKAIFRMKDGGTIAIDRKQTPYHLSELKDGFFGYEMKWVDIYPWNINEYNLFSGEYVDDYVEQELAKLLSNSVLIELELEDEIGSDYIITVSECMIQLDDDILNIPIQLTRPEPKILTSSMEFSKMMTVSTGHITKETARGLEKESFSDSSFSLSVYKGDFGWIVHVPNCEQENISEDLSRLMTVARENGCDWLCLDSDGPELIGLPTYDW